MGAILFETESNNMQVLVSDICRHTNMTADAIRANGLSFSDEMDIDMAIEFVRKRTVAAGRWTQEKAEKSIVYLAELNRIKSESNNVKKEMAHTGPYFAGIEYPVSCGAAETNPKADIAPTVPKVVPSVVRHERDYSTLAFRGIYGAGIIAHAALIVYECNYLWGMAGLIASIVVALVIIGSVILMGTDAHQDTTQDLLWFIWFLDGCAFFVHKAALYHESGVAYAAGINEFGTGCLAAVICLCAGCLAYFYRKTGLKK